MFEMLSEPAEDVFGTPLPYRAGPPGERRGLQAVPRPGALAADGWSTRTEPSAAVQALLTAVQRVVAQVPVELPGSQALADTAALLRAVEQLHAAVLTRVADVDARKLHVLAGAPSTGTWVAQQQTSMDRSEVALARRLASMPTLDDAVREGRLSVAGAEHVGKALAKLRRHVDRPDGLVDGQPAEQVLAGVIGHGVPDQVCQAMGGLEDDDPRLSALRAQVAGILQAPAGELARLEAAFVLLAEHLEPGLLPSALGMLVDACLPNELEKRAQAGHDNRGFTMRRLEDGSGWHIADAELDLETGELLHTVLQAEMATDPDNPSDTAGYQQLRAAAWQAGDPLPEVGSGGPRSLRQRRHDALKHALRRLLDSGRLGLRDKRVPHISVTVGLDALQQAPGALPGVAGSGVRLPCSLIRRWWCDATAARFVLSLGRRVIETSHSQRTLKAHERQIKLLETGGRCEGAGCSRGGPLIPHHADPWARCRTTSVHDTVMVCEQTHHDIHAGKTIRLKDGRYLNDRGWTDGPGG